MTILSDLESADDVKPAQDDVPVSRESVTVQSHVLVRYETSRKIKLYYAGVVLSVDKGMYRINFMKKVQGSAACFIYPENEDRLGKAGNHSAIISRPYICMRDFPFHCQSYVSIQVDLSDFNIP